MRHTVNPPVGCHRLSEGARGWLAPNEALLFLSCVFPSPPGALLHLPTQAPRNPQPLRLRPSFSTRPLLAGRRRRCPQQTGERSHKPKTIRIPCDPQLFMNPPWMILWIIHMAHGYTKNTATRRVPNNHLLLFLICGIHVMMFRSRRQGHGSAA